MAAQSKPIFLATHPRACSTAFERVMMTRGDVLTCIHEPFGDAFYYGPERLAERFRGDEHEAERLKSGFSETTYKDVVEKIEKEGNDHKGKRIFIKDITHYLLTPDPIENPATIAASLRLHGLDKKKGYGTSAHCAGASAADGENGKSTNGTISPEDHDNPTVIPLSLLHDYHFTFLIRHPRRAIPSYYRCTIPPLSKTTGFDYFLPSEAGYRELRLFFDYVRSKGIVDNGEIELCVIDADDLLNDPEAVMKKYCESVGLEFTSAMLKWEEKEKEREAELAFEKWKGFHEDAIKSSGLKARESKRKEKSEEEEFEEWVQKYGEEGARIISETVKENLADYEYLRGFKIQV
ncbi:hypothetical protein RUND412_008105 [Rhizina undulata]